MYSGVNSGAGGNSEGFRRKVKGFTRTGRPVNPLDAHYLEYLELVGQSPEKKNWKGICISLFIIVAIVGCVVLAVVFVSPSNGVKLVRKVASILMINYTEAGGSEPVKIKPNITMTDVLQFEFGVTTKRYQWLRDNRLAYFDGYENLVAFSVAENSTSVLMRNTTLAFTPSPTIVDWKISVDEQFILLKYNSQKLNRYSTLSEFYITTLGDESAFPTGTPPTISIPQDLAKFFNDRSQLRFAIWSPTDSKIAFHASDVLYFVESPFNTVPVEVFKGERDLIFAGVPDWLYEEDILKSDTAIWWSPDSRFLLFAVFNDSTVPQFSVPYYDHRDIYSCQRQVHYPKAGDKDAYQRNPTFEVYILDTLRENTDQSRLERIYPSTGTPIDNKPVTGCTYLTAVTWINSSSVLMTCQNRFQNHTTIFRYQFSHPMSWRGREMPFPLAQKAPAGGAWLPRLNFLNFGDATFMIWPSMTHPQAYRQIYLLPKALRTAFSIGGGDLAPILQACGQFDVQDIVHFDVVNNLLYFIAAANETSGSDTRMRNLFAVSVFATHPDYKDCSSLVCVSCQFHCLYGRPEFSQSLYLGGTSQLILYHCEAPLDVEAQASHKNEHIVSIGVPYSAIYRLAINNGTVEPELVQTVQENQELRQLYDNRSWPIIEWHRIELNKTANGLAHHAWARILFSPQINRKHIFAFPLLLIVDNEPQSSAVTLQFRLSLEYFLSAAMGVVAVKIDGRGTFGQGLAFEQAVHKRLGNYELQDQLKAVEYFQKMYNFVERRKTAVFGMSYGGYLATKLATVDQTLVRCSIAIAPIVQWHLHYSTFTERYLGQWLENTGAYYDSSIRISDSREILANLKKHQLFVIHGLSDDNVHFQHTALLAEELRNKHALYHFQALPNLDHTLGQHLESLRKNLHETVIEVLTDCYEIIPAYQTERFQAKSYFKQQIQQAESTQQAFAHAN